VGGFALLDLLFFAHVGGFDFFDLPFFFVLPIFDET